jgi:hypothetical protein
MLIKRATMALGLVIAASGGSACAMNTPPSSAVQCTVQGTEKLPQELGGAEGICRAIDEAVASTSGQGGYPAGTSVVVQVRSSNLLAATVTEPTGRRLPEIEVSISDRVLNRHAVRSLAEQVAHQLAQFR